MEGEMWIQVEESSGTPMSTMRKKLRRRIGREGVEAKGRKGEWEENTLKGEREERDGKIEEVKI